MKHFILLFALCMIGLTSQLSAQNVPGLTEIGLYTAAHFGFFSTTIPDITGVNAQSTDVSTSGYSIGGMVKHHLSQEVALLGIVRYDYLSLHATQSGATDTYTYHNGEKVEYSLFASSRFDVPQIATTILCQYNVVSKLNILAGAQVGFLMNDTEENRYGLLFNYQYPMSFDDIPSKIPTAYKGQTPSYHDDTHTSFVLYKGEIYQRQSMQFAVAGGLSWDMWFPTGSNKYSGMSIYFLMTYNLTSFSRYEEIHGLTACFGVTLAVPL